MNMKKYQFGFGESTMELSLPVERVLYDIKGTLPKESLMCRQQSVKPCATL